MCLDTTRLRLELARKRSDVYRDRYHSLFVMASGPGGAVSSGTEYGHQSFALVRLLREIILVLKVTCVAIVGQ
jgi:hypothetical protein